MDFLEKLFFVCVITYLGFRGSTTRDALNQLRESWREQFQADRQAISKLEQEVARLKAGKD